MSATPRAIHITEVGPRDGLQNEKTVVSARAKVAFVDAIVASGVKQVEVSSFVRPDRVPAMADAEEVFRGINRQDGVRYLALVPNMRGYERARSVGCDALALFTAASDAFTRRNVRMTIDESLRKFAVVAKAAARDGVAVRGYVSTIFACPFAGPVAADAVVPVVQRLLDLGCYEVSLGDTIGVGTPADVRRLLDALLARFAPDDLVMHFHDTWGMGVANAMASIAMGITRFDASAGGLGGCPYAPGATGNLATEDILYALSGSGHRTGIDIEGVASAVAAIQPHIGRELPGRVHHAILARRCRRDRLGAGESEC